MHQLIQGCHGIVIKWDNVLLVAEIKVQDERVIKQK